jgi:O-antigen/teichoic acid export membrane protein
MWNKAANNMHRRLATGTIWNLIATLLNQGSIFAVNVIVARILGIHAFGEYSIIVGTLVTAAVLVQLSMGYTSTKYVSEYRSIDKEKTGRIIGLCMMLSIGTATIGVILILPASTFICTFFMKAAHLSTALMIGTGYLFFAAVNGFQVGVYAGLEGYHNLAKAAIISGVITVSGIAFGAIYFQLIGALIGLSATAMIRCLLHSYWLHKLLKMNSIVVRYRGLTRERNIFRTFALPAALSGYITLPALWLGNTILIRQQGGFEKLALYNAAFSFRMAVMFIPVVVNNVGMTIMNNYKGKGDAIMYWKTFRLNLAVSASSVVCVALVLIMEGPAILNLFGKEFGNAFPVLRILLLATLFEGLSMSIYQIIQSHAKLWCSLVFIAIPYCTFFVVLAYYLSPRYGAVGLAIAYAAGWSVNLIATGLLSLSITSASIWPAQEVQT